MVSNVFVNDLLRAIPKVQLHCHLEGTLRPSRFLELAQRHGVDLGARAGRPLEHLYDFSDFREFLLLFRDVCETLREPGDFARLAADYVDDAAAQGVRYAEIFVSPSVWTWFHRELDLRETFARMRAAIDDRCLATGMDVSLICDLTRNFGPERALETARVALAMRDLGVIGVGLGGDEAVPPALFVDAVALAREGGLHVVVHAGEAAGAHSVREAIERLGAERIGHGVRALEDPEVVAMLRDRRIPVEVCPTSNRLTGAVARDTEHPIGELDASNVIVTLDADDPALFAVSLLDEYEAVERTLGLATAVRFARNGIDASFAPAVTKRRLHAAFQKATAGAV